MDDYMKRFVSLLSFVLILSAIIFGQQDVEALKGEAKSHMHAARFGEAIDLLNKVITSQPRNAENYYLRAKCFEYRNAKYDAVIDYRRAINLMNSDVSVSS